MSKEYSDHSQDKIHGLQKQRRCDIFPAKHSAAQAVAGGSGTLHTSHLDVRRLRAKISVINKIR